MLSLQRRFSLKAVRRFAERLKTQLDLSEKTDLLISLFWFASQAMRNCPTAHIEITGSTTSSIGVYALGTLKY